MSAPKVEPPIEEKLRAKARAFNDAGLRYGVADTLLDGAEEIDRLHAELARERSVASKDRAFNIIYAQNGNLNAKVTKLRDLRDEFRAKPGVTAEAVYFREAFEARLTDILGD